MNDPVAQLVEIPRARENPKPVPPGGLQIRSEKRIDGYVLQASIAAESLTGFDPAEQLRLGFSYAVTDREMGWQTLSVGPEFPFLSDPSLWGTLELQPSGRSEPLGSRIARSPEAPATARKIEPRSGRCFDLRQHVGAFGDDRDRGLVAVLLQRILECLFDRRSALDEQSVDDFGGRPSVTTLTCALRSTWPSFSNCHWSITK